MLHGEGQKKSQKSVTFYLNDPKQPETCDSAYCANKKQSDNKLNEKFLSFYRDTCNGYEE